MASETQVTLTGPIPGALDVAEKRLRELEQRWSRFLPDSDVSRLNTTPETWVPISPDTVTLIQTMQLAVEATGGGYDPTFLHQLIEAGYTTSIDGPAQIAVTVDLPCPDHSVFDVRIDMAGPFAWVPTGLALDPGGIGKGLAADLVVTESLHSGVSGALVSIGGDIAAAGVAPTCDGWIIDVEDPVFPDSVLTTLAVSDGGIATSSTRTRRWEVDGTPRHHVIDPKTGTCSRTDLAAVTVVGNAGWLAEVHATAALLSGSAHAVDYLESRGLIGLATTCDATTSTTRELVGLMGRVEQ
jgi:thiamine biosynthesis lipoprotein